MAVSRHPVIAREGNRPLVVVALVTIVLLAWKPPAAIPALVVLVALLWLYRDPARQIPSAPLGVVSPVDGHVLEVSEAHDPFLDRPACRIRLRMSPFGVFSLRSLTEGKISNQWLGRLPAETGGGKGFAVWVQTDEGDDVVAVFRRGRLFGQMTCSLASGERVGQGERCGFILFGSVADVWLPANVALDVAAGDRVHAGQQVLARLSRG